MQAKLIPESPGRVPLSLRDYQESCIKSLYNYGVKGGKRALVALPTGSGKTVVFAAMAGMASKRVLVLAHREELLGQAKEKITDANPSLIVELEQASNHATSNADVIVASVQTFAVNDARLKNQTPSDFSAIVVDEAHHAMARSYIKILHHFGLAPNPARVTRSNRAAIFENFKPLQDAPFLTGFTATPSRTDGIGLEYLFDELVFSRTIREMMEAEWLCKIRAIRVDTATDISEVKTKSRYGDYRESALATAVNTDERNSLAVKSYLEYASGRQALAFCVDVDHTIALTETFRSAGIEAEYVVGANSRMERSRDSIIRDYQSGEVQVLVNCMVLTEGFDAPNTSALIMARPTKSQLLYTQMLGRGTRKAQGKEDLLVIDLADIAKTGIADVNTLFGLPPRFETNDDDILTVRKAIDELEGQIPFDAFQAALNLEQMRTQAAEFDPLKMQTMEGLGQLAWVKTPYGAVLSMFDGTQFGVIENTLGHVEIRMKPKGRVAEIVGQAKGFVQGVEIAETWIRKNRGQDYRLQNNKAAWRGEAPSEAQLKLARRWYTESELSDLTKGEVSILLDAKMRR